MCVQEGTPEAPRPGRALALAGHTDRDTSEVAPINVHTILIFRRTSGKCILHVTLEVVRLLHIINKSRAPHALPHITQTNRLKERN